MKIFVFALAALTICGAYAAVPAIRDDGPQCKAPNGAGLEPVFKEFIDLIPIEEVLNVFLNALSNDEQVQAVFAYLESDEFYNLAETLIKTKEAADLIKLACTKCYLDVPYYYNKLAAIIGLPPMEHSRVAHLRIASRARPGLHGMLEDILELLPIETMKALMEEKLESDEYVKSAVEILKSKDFQSLLDTLRNHPSYNHMLQNLRDMDVDVDKVLEFLRKFFDWS